MFLIKDLEYNLKILGKSRDLSHIELQFENGVHQVEQDIGESIERNANLTVEKTGQDSFFIENDFFKLMFKKFKVFFNENPEIFKKKFSKYVKTQVKKTNSADYVLFLENICINKEKFSKKVNFLLKASKLKKKKKLILKFIFKIINKILKN